MKKRMGEKTCLRLVLLLLCVASSGCVVIDGGLTFGGPELAAEFRRQQKVPDDVLVEIQNGSGRTEVFGEAGGNEVRVEGRFCVRAGDATEARRILDQLSQNPPFELRGKTLTIGELDESVRSRSRVSLDITVTVPRGARLTARSGSADQVVHDVDGDVEVSSGSGDLRVDNIGGRLVAKSGSGDIDARDLRGDGDFSTGSGDIRAENIAGGAEASSGSGSLRLAYIGGRVRADTASGDLVVREAKADLRAHTASGDIRIDSVLAAGSRWELESVSGEIEMALPAGSRFEIDARSRSGSVSTDFSVRTGEFEEARRALRGTVGAAGAGDASIHARSSSGSIRLRRQ